MIGSYKGVLLYCCCHSVAHLCPTLWDPINYTVPGFPVLLHLRSLLKLMSIELVMASSHLILCCPLLLLPAIFSSIMVFSSDSALRIRWPKYWSFSSSTSNIQGRFPLIDWFDLLAVQGTRKSLLQHHNSKASILQCLAFFMVQLSHPYMTTGKNIALVIWNFVGKMMSLLLNMLSRFVIAFLPGHKRLLISWLQSPFIVILEPKKIKSVTVSTVAPSICHEVMGPDTMIFIFLILSSKPAFSLSSFTFIKRLFSSSSLSAISMVSSAYLSLLIFLPAVLIPACASSSLVFRMMYSAYKLNKQGDNIQPWCTPFPILNQFIVPCLVLTVAWPAYRFLRRQVRWSGIPICIPRYADDTTLMAESERRTRASWWDGWMASPTQWTWIWANSGR